MKHSKWAAPIVVVLKDKQNPGGPIRICGDYKITVNAAAPCDNYPLPNTTEQLADLAGGERFTKIDLSQAYQQLQLDEESQELLTVSTHKGLYQPNRLQYGVHSATGIFQREIERVLKGISKVWVRVDDILVTGKDDIEHLLNVIKVLDALLDAGLTVNMKKCEILKSEVVFCGYRVSKEGVRPMLKNVEAVCNAPEPKNASELKSYLGMLVYYQSYMKSLSTITEPLHRLLKKDVKWVWEDKERASFVKTKQMLVDAPVLVHFNPSLPIVVHADASPYGVGAVLSHVLPSEEEKPVSFASRTLSVAERNYGHVEKEGLALVFAVKKFHHFLFGYKFFMYTDHKPLLGLFGENKGIPERSAARIARWALLLSAYNYNLRYRPGVQNANADGLSRLPVEALEEDVTGPCIAVHMMELVSAPVSSKEISEETVKDEALSKVLVKVREGWKGTEREEMLAPYLRRKDELAAEEGCVLWGQRVIIPESLRNKVLQELHEMHIGMSKMKALARSYLWWPGLDRDIEEMAKTCEKCQSNQRNPAKVPVHHWEQPEGPWKRVHLDFAGPFIGRMFLIVVDAFSKWIEVEVMSDITARSTISKLRGMFATFGLPETMVSDNGPAFIAAEFQEFMKKNLIRHLFSAPYHPSSNGQAERAVRTFKESMKLLQHGDTQTKLDRLLYRYRMTPHSTTGKSPAELMFGRKLNSTFGQLKPETKSQRRGGGNDSKKVRSFEEGSLVWYKNFNLGNKWLPGIISKRLGKVVYEVRQVNEGKVNRHVDHLVLRVVQDTTKVQRNLVSNTSASSSFDIDIDYEDLRSEDKESTVVRRSGRATRKPQWMKDFSTEGGIL